MALLPGAWSRSVAAQKVLDFVNDDTPPTPAAPTEVPPAPVVDLVARRLLLLAQ